MFSRLLQSKSKQSCVAVGENHSPFKICALNAHFVTLQNDDVVRDAGYGRLGIEYGANISIMPLHLPFRDWILHRCIFIRFLLKSSIVIDIPFDKQNMKMQKLLNPLFGEIRNEYVWGGVCVRVWKDVTRDRL